MRLRIDADYWSYLKKSSLWFLGNAFFGLIPLLFILFLYLTSAGKVGYEEIDHLIHDGVILFVCSAIMGSVLVDLMLSGLSMKVSSCFGLLIIPAIVIMLLLTDYLLINLKIIENKCFELDSGTSFAIMILAIPYTITIKLQLSLKQKL